MHDVLDIRDLVVDEAEQLSLSGFDVGDLGERARAAVRDGDGDLLESIYRQLEALQPAKTWQFAEPFDVATLTELADQAPVLAVNRGLLAAKLHGAWTGRAVGNTIGKPVEGLTRSQVEAYLTAAGQWPLDDFLPLIDPLPEGVAALHPSAPVATAGNFDDVPRDDDIDWSIVALHVLEKYGRGFSTEDVAREWLDRVPFTQTYTAERAAYRNLIHGLAAPETATHRNPYREWIGALIRGDVFGFVNPGRPGAAAQLALVDARLSHTGNGVYGELWAAALCSAALGEGDVSTVFEAALAVVPESSRLSSVLRAVAALRRDGSSWQDALDWVDTELADYPWVHTVNNAALIAIALLWGSSYIDAIHVVVAGGRDTDSNAATVGSVWGAMHGAESIPAHLIGTTHLRVRSAVRDFDRVAIDELVARTLALVE